MTRTHYPIGALVLAKVKGFPPWPAEVVDPVQFEQEPKKDKIFVFFFQPRQVRYCSPEEVIPFAGEAKEAAVARTKTKSCLADFKVALAEAIEEEKKRPPLPPEGEDAHDEEGDEEDKEEEEEEDEEEEEEEEEEAVETPSRKRATKRVQGARKAPAQKRTKTDNGWKTPRPPKPRTTGRPSGTAKQASSNESLLDIVKHKAKLVDAGASSWVERYLADQDEAIAELLTFLFQACGARYVMEPEDPSNEKDVDDVVQLMVQAAKEGDVEDLLSSKQKELKNFKQNLLQFWHSLVLECQDTVLFDERLISKVTGYVIALACTSPRTFRHVATIIALQLVTSYVTVATSLVENRETMQRQLNAETKKKSTGPRLESLTKSLADINEKVAAVGELMRELFTGVFMHRYRDVDADIRVACISSLGSWIEKYPSLFLQDLYLKYIGWTLNDKVAAVRQSSITALCNLYNNEDFIPALGLFTERFQNRMIELADDVDIGVAVKAINLLQELMRHELVGDEDLMPLYELLFDESSQIRQAVGKIIYEQRIVPAGRASGSASASKAKEKRGSEGQLLAVLQLLAEYSTSPALSLYVIDALGENDAMMDWKCMTKMLLNEQSSDELSEDDATNLIRILNASIKKATGEKIVPIVETKKHITKGMRDAFELNRQTATTTLMRTFPQLLRKFMADGAKVANLVDIVFHLDLEMFSIKRQETSFSNMLQLLREAFLKHGDMDVLQKCARALSFCAKEGHAELKDMSALTLSDTGKEVATKLQEIAQVTASLEDDVEKEYSLIVNMRRSYQFQLVSDISSNECFDSIVGLLDDYNSLDDEMVSLALVNLFLQVTWTFATLSMETPGEEAIAALVAKRAKLMEHLEALLDGLLEAPLEGTARLSLASQVVEMLTDFWCLFSKNKLQGSTMEELGYCPREDLLRSYWKLCEALLEAPEVANEEEESQPSCSTFSKEFVIGAAAKLVAYDLVPQDFLAPEIVSHYVLHNKGVADMVKLLCSKLKAGTPSPDLSHLYSEALKRAYERHMETVGDEDSEEAMASPSYVACRELASKLSAMFVGFGRTANRGSILKIVASGLHLAFTDAPRHLSFLEAGVVQFALKLGPEDLLKITKEAEKRVEGVNMDEHPSAWRPFTRMMEQLQDKAAKADPAAGGREREEVPKRRGRPPRAASRGNGKRLSYAEKSAEEEDEIEGEDENPESQDGGEQEADDDEDVPLEEIRRSSRAPQPRAWPTIGGPSHASVHATGGGPGLDEIPRQAPPAATPSLHYSRKRKAPPVPESPLPTPSGAGTPLASPAAGTSHRQPDQVTDPSTETETGTGTGTGNGSGNGSRSGEETETETDGGTQTSAGEGSLWRELRSKTREDKGLQAGEEEEEGTPGRMGVGREEDGKEDVYASEEVYPGSFTATEEQLPRAGAKRMKRGKPEESEDTGFDSIDPTQSTPPSSNSPI